MSSSVIFCSNQISDWMTKIDPLIKVINLSEIKDICFVENCKLLICCVSDDNELLKFQEALVNVRQQDAQVLICALLDDSLIESAWGAIFDFAFSPAQSIFKDQISFIEFVKFLLKITDTSAISVGAIEIGNLKIDFDEQNVFVWGESRRVSKIEFQLLKILAENKNKIVKTDDILQEVWGDLKPMSNNIHSQVYNLKKKLFGIDSEIVAIHGVGLILQESRT